MSEPFFMGRNQPVACPESVFLAIKKPDIAKNIGTAKAVMTFEKKVIIQMAAGEAWESSVFD